MGEWRTVSAVSVYATRCDAHVNRLDICGRFAETPQHHLFFGVNAEKTLCLCASVAIIFVDAIAQASASGHLHQTILTTEYTESTEVKSTK